MAHNYRLLQEEASKPHRDLSKLTELVLHMAFYWYNFMPLSRGTAAVGTFTPLRLQSFGFMLEDVLTLPSVRRSGDCARHVPCAGLRGAVPIAAACALCTG